VDTILQVKLKLLGVAKPPVWRRLLVPVNTTLDQMHSILQSAMGWEDYHMHVFSDGDLEYGIPDRELGFSDEREVTLGDVFGDVGDKLLYTYDFGDGWEHVVVLEDLLDAVPAVAYPVCLAGKGCCPPEDCGGVWGYHDLRASLADRANERHDELVEWLGLVSGSDFDPGAFDLDAVNVALQQVRAGI
jgi:hypothetical protein